MQEFFERGQNCFRKSSYRLCRRKDGQIIGRGHNARE